MENDLQLTQNMINIAFATDINKNCKKNIELSWI